MKTKFIKSKRIISVVLAVCMVLSLGVSKQTKAATTTRKTLALNQTYTETWEDDETKIFQFTVPQAGNINIEIKNTNATGSEEVRVWLYNSNNVNILDEEIGVDIKLPTYSSDANKTYYLKVSDWKRAEDTSFSITIHFQATTNWESENNDTTATADGIEANRSYKGMITENDDCDYFKFYLSGNRKVNIKFGPAEVDGGGYSWYVNLLNSKNESKEIACSGTSQTYTTYLKKGTYYLKIKNFSRTKNIPYTFSYTTKSLKIKQPKITSIKGSAHKGLFSNYVQLTRIKIKNSGDCQGYQVQVAKKKSMKGRLANQMVSFENGNSKGKVSLETGMGIYKKYYVRVRGYVTDLYGKKIYGKYSKVKCYKMKKSTYKKFKN